MYVMAHYSPYLFLYVTLYLCVHVYTSCSNNIQVVSHTDGLTIYDEVMELSEITSSKHRPVPMPNLTTGTAQHQRPLILVGRFCQAPLEELLEDIPPRSIADLLLERFFQIENPMFSMPL